MYTEKTVSLRKPVIFKRHISESTFAKGKCLTTEYMDVEIYLNKYERTSLRLTSEQCHVLIHYDLPMWNYGDTIELYASLYDYDDNSPMIEIPAYAYPHLKRIVRYYHKRIWMHH